MHELAFTQSLLDLALRHAAQARAVRVRSLHLVIGQLASVVDDSVQFYWDLLCPGTPCEGAQLRFERIPATLLCQACGTAYILAGELAACPACGGANVRVTAGDECHLQSIEIETATDGEKPAT